MNKKRANSPGSRLLNILSVLALGGTAAVIAVSLIIYYRPNHAINPFPPATLPASLILPTSTSDAQQPTPSNPFTAVGVNTTAQSPAAASATKTARPTIWNAQQTSAPLPSLPAMPSSTSITVNPSSAYHYQIQSEPEAISADLFDSSRSNCEWMGVAGQVKDLDGSPVTGILVLLGGSLEFKTLNQTTITGTARNYGPAGYEFSITDHLVESKDAIWVQLVDQSYVPLSARVYFDTYDDCDKSLVIVNFKQVR